MNCLTGTLSDPSFACSCRNCYAPTNYTVRQSSYDKKWLVIYDLGWIHAKYNTQAEAEQKALEANTDLEVKG